MESNNLAASSFSQDLLSQDLLGAADFYSQSILASNQDQASQPGIGPHGGRGSHLGPEGGGGVGLNRTVPTAVGNNGGGVDVGFLSSSQSLYQPHPQALPAASAATATLSTSSGALYLSQQQQQSQSILTSVSAAGSSSMGDGDSGWGSGGVGVVPTLTSRRPGPDVQQQQASYSAPMAAPTTTTSTAARSNRRQRGGGAGRGSTRGGGDADVWRSTVQSRASFEEIRTIGRGVAHIPRIVVEAVNQLNANRREADAAAAREAKAVWSDIKATLLEMSDRLRKQDEARASEKDFLRGFAAKVEDRLDELKRGQAAERDSQCKVAIEAVKGIAKIEEEVADVARAVREMMEKLREMEERQQEMMERETPAAAVIAQAELVGVVSGVQVRAQDGGRQNCGEQEVNGAPMVSSSVCDETAAAASVAPIEGFVTSTPVRPPSPAKARMIFESTKPRRPGFFERYFSHSRGCLFSPVPKRPAGALVHTAASAAPQQRPPVPQCTYDEMETTNLGDLGLKGVGAASEALTATSTVGDGFSRTKRYLTLDLNAACDSSEDEFFF